MSRFPSMWDSDPCQLLQPRCRRRTSKSRQHVAAHPSAAFQGHHAVNAKTTAHDCECALWQHAPESSSFHVVRSIRLRPKRGSLPGAALAHEVEANDGQRRMPRLLPGTKLPPCALLLERKGKRRLGFRATQEDHAHPQKNPHDEQVDRLHGSLGKHAQESLSPTRMMKMAMTIPNPQNMPAW